MAYRKRTRSQAQKAHKKFNERLLTLRSKVEELNTITEGRAILVSAYKGKTSTHRDQLLLKRLGYTIQSHPSGNHQPTLSPTDSASLFASPVSQSRTDSGLFDDGEIFGLGSLQEKQPPTVSANGSGFKLKGWRKEDLVSDGNSEIAILAKSGGLEHSPENSAIWSVHLAGASCPRHHFLHLDLLAYDFFGDE